MKKFFEEFWQYRVEAGRDYFVIYTIACIFWIIVVQAAAGIGLKLFPAIAGGIAFSAGSWLLCGFVGVLMEHVGSLPELLSRAITGGILMLYRR